MMKIGLKLCVVIFSAMILSTSCKSTDHGDSISEWIAVDGEVSRIWSEAPHSAFTDLIYFNDAFYCTFREGLDHVSGPNGSVRIIRSSNGEAWESIAHYEFDGKDTRDPKLSITPDNRIMLLMDVERYSEGKVVARTPYVSFSDASGDNFSTPLQGSLDPAIPLGTNWLWRVTWHEGMGYGVTYSGGAGINLVRTTDGINYEFVHKLEVDGSPNECTVRFDDTGKMYVLIRREGGNKMGMLAKSIAPYNRWEYKALSFGLGGPDFQLFGNNKLVIGTRILPNRITALLVTDLNGKIVKQFKLPSRGDTSYPGLVIRDNYLYVSYYSSHEDKTAIYFAKIPVVGLQ